MPAGHMAAYVNPSARLPVGFKHEFGGCGNRVTSLGGRARSIFHFTQQLVESSARCPSARLGRGTSQVRAVSLLVGLFHLPGRHSFARFMVCARQLALVATGAVSGLRCVWSFGVSRSLAITSPALAHRIDLHPSTATSRWSPVVSHFFDGTRPVALVGTRCSYRKRLPLSSAGTEWNVLSSSHAGRPSFTRHISSTRARSSPVRPLLVSRSRDLPSSVGGLFCLCSVLGPMRSLRACRPAARAFSIRSPRAR
jgi:hypothetical protein